MIQEQQKCLDADCDDYLAKAVDRSILMQTIARYTPVNVAQLS
jgi:hypothetical protein